MFSQKIKVVPLRNKQVYHFYVIDSKQVIRSSLRVAGIVGISVVIFGAIPIISSADSGIDIAARGIYKKLLSVGKWIIIIKGGIDTVNSVVQGDHASAKKSFLSYLVVYVILQGFPWAMDEIDRTFSEWG